MTAVMRFRNMEDLQNEAQLKPDLETQLKRVKKAAEMFDKAKTLFKKACDMKDNDPEQSYMLFCRCMHICNMVLHCPDFKSFSQSETGITFRSVYERSMDEYERLESRLKRLYADRECANAENLPPVPMEVPAPKYDLHPVDREDFGNFIKPIQLVDYVEKLHKLALIVDYRPNKLPGVLYGNLPFIRVLPIDVSMLVPGLIFNHIRMHLDFRYRPLLSEIQGVDLVVLMGEELENANAAPFREGCPTKILLNALTEYNYSHPLKRKPLLLEGGFKAWQITYPMFVEWPSDRQNRMGELGLADEFTELVQQVKKGAIVKIEYPSLSPDRVSPIKANRVITSRPDSPSDYATMPVYPQPTSNRSEVHHIPVFVESANSYVLPPEDPARASSQTSVSFSSASTQPTGDSEEPEPTVRAKPALPKAPPLVDRSNKPAIAELQPSKLTNATEFPVAFDSEPVPFNNRTLKPSSNRAKFERALPQFKTLGGARVDTPPQSSTGAPVLAKPRPPPPPIPDRNNKIVDDPEDIQHRNAVLQLYDQSMRLIEDSAERAPVPPGYTGLVNLGNTCFMNSTLQALFNAPGMRSVFTRSTFFKKINPKNKDSSRGTISACFSSLMDAVWSGRYRYFRPNRFLDVFAAEINPTLANRKQQDAQEFQMYLLCALHEDTNRVVSKKVFEQNYDGKDILRHADHYSKHLNLVSSSPINDLFDLRSILQLTCATCNTSSVTFEDNSQIILALPDDYDRPYCTLRECLAGHFGDNFLDGGCRWNCPRCKCPQRALRSTRVWSLPPVLIIILSRFAQKNGECVKKTLNVNFDIRQLDMSPYVHKEALNRLDQSPVYHLYGITNHEGSLNSGHYTSRIYNARSRRWLKFDDEYVTEIDPASIQTQGAYILYYTNVVT